MGYGLSLDQVELMKGPMLSASLPIVFDNSEKIEGVVVRCPECDRTIPDVLVRGRVQRPTERVAVVHTGVLLRALRRLWYDPAFLRRQPGVFLTVKRGRVRCLSTQFLGSAKRYFAPRHIGFRYA